jgi:excisionase family DNA binding protein
MSQFASLAHRHFFCILLDRKIKEVDTMPERKSKEKYDIPLYRKPFLSIEEAVTYTGIGRDKLYELTNPEDCPFVLWIGNRRMIKRRVFDEYIEKCYSI